MHWLSFTAFSGDIHCIMLGLQLNRIRKGGPDVGVRISSGVVQVSVERPTIQVIVPVTTDIGTGAVYTPKKLGRDN